MAVEAKRGCGYRKGRRPLHRRPEQRQQLLQAAHSAACLPDLCAGREADARLDMDRSAAMAAG